MLKYVKSFNCFGPCFEAPTREVNGLKALHVVCVLLSKGPAFHLLIEAKREHLQLHGGFASLVFMAESTNIHHHVEASQGQRNCCGRSTGQEGSYAPAALEGCVTLLGFATKSWKHWTPCLTHSYIQMHVEKCAPKRISKRRKSVLHLCQFETSWLSSAASNSFVAKPKLPGSDIVERTKMTKHISVEPPTLLACFLFAIRGCQVSAFAFQLETLRKDRERPFYLHFGCFWQPMCQAATCSIVQRSSFFTGYIAMTCR